MARARYYDGRSASARDVTLTPLADTLLVEGPGGIILDRWPFREIDLASGGEAGAVRLTRRDTGASLLTEDGSLVAPIRRWRRERARTGRHTRPAWLPVAGWIAAAALSVVLFFWFGLPYIATGVAQTVPVAWEVRFGARVTDQVAEMLSPGKVRECGTGPGLRALDRMVADLSAATPPRLQLKVRVIDVPVVNAFALPGGEVVVLRGLLDFMEHPNELAAVLGHEFAHSDLRHPVANAIKRGVGAVAVGLLLGDVTGISTTVIIAQALIGASYTREAETEADSRMYETMRRAGYATGPAAEFFARLEKKEGDSGGALSLFQTHPASADRAQRLREAVPRGADALTPAEWSALKTICGPVRARPPPPRQTR